MASRLLLWQTPNQGVPTGIYWSPRSSPIGNLQTAFGERHWCFPQIPYSHGSIYSTWWPIFSVICIAFDLDEGKPTSKSCLSTDSSPSFTLLHHDRSKLLQITHSPIFTSTQSTGLKKISLTIFVCGVCTLTDCVFTNLVPPKLDVGGVITVNLVIKLLVSFQLLFIWYYWINHNLSS